MSALERRERFEHRHPEIDIRARREDGRMLIYVREPDHLQATIWTDTNDLMDDLEARYPDKPEED